MHIPTTATKELSVLSFDEALIGSKYKNYDVTRWLYVPDFYSEYRYILGTKGERPLICIGINPSTAEPENLDNTLKSVQRISQANGFDSFIMFNVYAQRATDPDHMEKEINPFLHEENMKAFDFVLQNCKSTPCIWAAWGTIIEKRAYLPRCVRDMIEIANQYGARWYSAGKCSKEKGHPHHPLYLKKNEALAFFDVETYLKGFVIE